MWIYFFPFLTTFVDIYFPKSGQKLAFYGPTYPPHLVQVVFERPHRAVQKGFCFQPFQEVLFAKVGIVRFQCIGLTFGLIATSVNR